MSFVPQPPQEQAVRKTNWALGLATVAFILLAAGMIANLWGVVPRRPALPLVDVAFLDQTASRVSYADLVRAKEDLSDFKCYVCHEKDQPPPLRFDENHNLVLPEEHGNITMGHGTHNRNNLCYNCHSETNLLAFSTRDGHEFGFAESSHLCGSCHGPNLRDWEAGVHGRTNGYWQRSLGEYRRLDCVNCHDPHAPRIPTRAPAPGPHPLHAPVAVGPAHGATPSP